MTLLSQTLSLQIEIATTEGKCWSGQNDNSSDDNDDDDDDTVDIHIDLHCDYYDMIWYAN